MNNKYVMGRPRTVKFVKKNLTKYIYRNMMLARYDTTRDEVEDILLNCQNPESEIEIAVLNFKEAWDEIINNRDDEVNKDFLLKLHHILMKNLNENVETELTPIQEEEVHIMIDQPTKSNTETAIDVMEYILDKRLFSDGDVRVAIMFANKLMIDGGNGVITIRENLTDEFRVKLKAMHEEDGFKQFKNWIFKTSIEGIKDGYY